MNGLYLILALAAASASAQDSCFPSPTADMIASHEQCMSDCSGEDVTGSKGSKQSKESGSQEEGNLLHLVEVIDLFSRTNTCLGYHINQELHVTHTSRLHKSTQRVLWTSPIKVRVEPNAA
jgi:hypothetical protein